MSPHHQNKRLKVRYSRSVSPAAVPLPTSSDALHPAVTSDHAVAVAGCCLPTYPANVTSSSVADDFFQSWDDQYWPTATPSPASLPLTAIDGLADSATGWVDHHGTAPPTQPTVVPAPPSHVMTTVLGYAPDLTNPFVDNALEWIPTLGQARRYEDAAEVNGYIKCRFPQLRRIARTVPIYPSSARTVGLKRPLGVTGNVVSAPFSRPPLPPDYLRSLERRVPRLPPGFGFKQLSKPDRHLFMFYLNAWCTGRAILPNTNCWLTTIPSMAAMYAGVEHAMLALAGTYVLDYLPDERIRRRSNTHYNKAVDCLTDALNMLGDNLQSPEGEVLVASIALLNMMDVISPERRRPKDLPPRWLDGAEVACRILNKTDSGFRYWTSGGFQPSVHRIANTIISSRVVILALPMTPLKYISTESERFQFLLAHASEKDTRQIHGGCGCSPRLLHRFAQITYLTTLLHDTSDSVILPFAINRMLEEVHDLRQWSLVPDGSQSRLRAHEGYASTEELLHACDQILGPDMRVNDRVSMTFLTAEAWRLAAIIYLQCRLLRLPRSHKKVVDNFKYLAACIRRMPTSGPLFTAQAPFFPVFLLGLMAPKEPAGLHDCAQEWFEEVTSASCRSSVPPAFEAMKRIRSWIDKQCFDVDDDEIPENIGDRFSWWENVVHYIKIEEGVLCLV